MGYEAVDIDRCRKQKHHFILFGSDNTPMKRSLQCVECSHDDVQAIAAFGRSEASFGPWRRMEKDRDAGDREEGW
jgi:hypothetical protein